MDDDDYRKYGTSRAAHIEIADPHKCFVCGTFVPDDAVECPKCHFPQNGDEASQRQFLGGLRGEKIEEARAAFRVGHAFHLLLFMPIVFFLTANKFWVDGYITISEVSALVGCAFLSIWFFGRKDPYRAFTFSLALYAVISIPVFIYKPAIIMASRFWVLMPYLFLGIGMQSFKRWKRMDDDLQGKNTG